MKNYVIGTIGDQSPQSGAGYTIFRNPDEETKKKIAEFHIDRNKVKVKTGYPHQEWNILEWEDEEVKCGFDRNIHYYKRVDIEKLLDEQEEYERNQTFSPTDIFKKCFGVISWLRDSEYKYGNGMHRSVTLDKLNLNRLIPFTFTEGGPPITPNPRSVEFCDKGTYYDLGIHIGGEIKFEIRQSGQSINLFFNKDGDFVNRNYNQNLANYEARDIDPVIVFDAFKEAVLALNTQDLEGLEKGTRFFSDTFCFTPYVFVEDNGYKIILGIDAIPVKPYEKGVYKEYRKAVIYKPTPAKCVKKDAQQILDYIISQIPEEYSYIADYFKPKTS